jgi:hypothetical protein
MLALEQLAAEMGHSLAAPRAYFRLNHLPGNIRTDQGALSLPLLMTTGNGGVGQVGLASI